MFSFKSIALFLAAATTVVNALPSPNAAGGALAKRAAEAAPAPMAFQNVARAAAPEPAALSVVSERATGPATIPECIDVCKKQIDVIFVDVGMYCRSLYAPVPKQLDRCCYCC